MSSTSGQEQRKSSETHTPAGPPAAAGRRRFLSGLILTLAALAGLMLAVPVLGFLLAPLLRRMAQVWRPVGLVDDFQVGATVEVRFQDSSPLQWAGSTAETAAWLRRDSADAFTAFTVNCTHLGCPVRWLPDAKLFMCPCHGGVYYSDGRVAAGPPPGPLARYRVRINNGQVEILTSPIPLAT